MRHRLFPALLFVLLIPAMASAQAQPRAVTFGVKAGASLSTLSLGDPSLTPTALTNPVIGAFVTFRICRQLAIQPEVLYARRGATIDEGAGILAFTETERITYLAVPVFARLSFGGTAREGHIRPYVLAGPEFGFRLKATETGEILGAGTGTEDVLENYRRTDIGLAVGAGVEIARFLVEGRYTLGLTNIDATGVSTLKNRVFAILAGVRF
jgi:hypothetical protein